MAAKTKIRPCHEHRFYKLMDVMLVAVYAAGIIPVLYASFFSHPLADDYSSAYETHLAISSGGLLSVIPAAISHMVRVYSEWQGTWSAEILFALQPGIFGENAYFITTVVMLTMLTASVLVLSHELISIMAGKTRSAALCIGLSSLFFMVQFVPSPADSFFWWNGSVYYTFFFALSLFVIAVMVKIIRTGSPVMAGTATVIALIVGGGNYTTALLTFEIVILMIAVCFIYMNKYKWRLIPAFIALTCSFGVSVAAPGNQVRMSSVGSGMSAISAVKAAIVQAVVFIREWMDLPILAFIILLVPIILMAGKSVKNILWSHVIICFAVTFLLFASELAPAYFGIGNYGEERQVDIYYYSFILFVATDEFVLVTKIRNHVCSSDLMSACFVAASAILVITGCMLNGWSSPTSGACLKAAINGSLRTYDHECQAMSSSIITEVGKSGDSAAATDVIIDGVESTPEIFHDALPGTDPEDWVNVSMAKYYGVRSITVR
ncbi:MAG: hypothetical protein GX685_03300 [Clostridiales bacterium]|nr:hypothetical protein [Clostridiales bacterium]